METFKVVVMEITKERWDKLLYLTENSLFESVSAYSKGLSVTEIELIMSVLRSNTPFNVVEK